MKIFAIRDESSQEQKDLAYLLYYEQEKRFYIELPENADAWETPLLLDSFVKRGETTVNSYWSKIWVEQRIVPPDRQNIGEILRDNHLKEYDEYELLMLAMGRCAQDDYYLVPIDEKDLPEEITKRFSKRIEDVLPLENHCLLVFFRDGAVKKCNLQKHFEKTKDTMLYRIGKSVPLTAADFRNFAAHRVINAAEAAEILGCSRQNIIDLTKRGKLHPIKASEKSTLYLKSEILKRNWQ